jgi:hypothetical protein
MSGILVASPHEQWADMPSSKHDATPYETFIKSGIRLLLQCDGLILLPGWPQSKGARLELDIACDLKMPVYFYNSDWTLTSMMRP